MKRIALGSVLLIVVAVLAYGYWFTATHGSLYVTVMDVSESDHARDVKPVEVSFLDSDGRVLAQATGSEAFGAISISSPAMYSCREIEQRAAFSVVAAEEWSTCFERQSRWLPTWIRDARTASLRMPSCFVRNLPVSVSENKDTWWLWWLPVRHIGGKSYTSFSLLITFKRDSCE